MEIRLLGPLELLADGRSLELRGGKPRALLCALAMRRGAPVSTDTLIDDLWGEAPPASAEASLQMHVSALRKVVGRDRVVFEAGAYRLVTVDVELDVDRFERLVDAGQTALASSDPTRAARLLKDAINGWRGDALAEVRYAEFAQPEIRRLEALRLVATERWVEADIAIGRHAGVLAPLRRLVADHPLHEGFSRLLITALWRCGEQAEALRAYEATRANLVEQLGAEPGPALEAAYRQVLEHGEDKDGPSLRGPTSRPSVPTAPTPIIGRDNVVAEICEAVRSQTSRLVTITGPGGVGKTRVALACAAALDTELAGGCAFVDLSALRDPASVPSALGDALGGVLDGDGSLAPLVRAPTAVVLDNFEQLIVAAPLVAQWLAEVPELSFIVTSRERLRLRGEREVSLGPLDPVSASRLFCARARDAGVEVEPDGDVALVCDRLDNLPLAVELVAPRTRLRSVRELAAGLAGPGDHANAPPDLPERQQTIRKTIAWSVDLLEADERRTFARLSVLQSPFSVDIAAKVTDATERSVASLLDKSLLYRLEDGRFDLLVSIRDYGGELLEASGERRVIAERHARWIEAVIAAADAAYTRGEEQDWLQFFRAHRADVDAALSFVEDHAERLGTLVAGAGRYWSNLGWLDPGLAWIDRALARTAPSSDARSRLLYCHGLLAWRVGDADAAEQSFSVSASYWEEQGRPDELMKSLNGLAQVALHRDRLDDAEALNRRVEQLAGEVDNEVYRLVALSNLAEISSKRGDFAAASERYEHIVAVARRRGDRSMTAFGLSNLGSCLVEQGEYSRARQSLVDALDVLTQLGWAEGVVYTLSYLAAVEVEVGDAERSRVLISAADLLAQRIQLIWQSRESERRDRTRRAVARMLDIPEVRLDMNGSLDPDEVVAAVVRARN